MAKLARKKAEGETSEDGKVNKAEEIRQAAKALPKPVRPRDIIAVLKDKGIEVSRRK